MLVLGNALLLSFDFFLFANLIKIRFEKRLDVQNEFLD